VPTHLGRALLAGLVALACAASATAAGADNGAWNGLSPTQKEALAPLAAQWSGIESAQRLKWLELAGRFSTMPAAERQRAQTRMAEWAALSPAERGKTRLQYQEAQRWSPQDRQERWEAYKTLEPEARQVLADRWKLEAKDQRASNAASSALQTKRNLIELPPPPVAPRQAATATSVRAPSGATTQPISRPGAEPPHHQPGVPKIAATPSFVDSATLLPKRGPQGAAVAAPAPAKSASSSR
jgi:hypothetical protein